MCRKSLRAVLSVLTLFGLSSQLLALNLEELKKQVDEGQAVLLDVREEVEWKRSHLAQSESVPLSTVATDAHARRAISKYTSDPEIKIYAISNKGKRAKVASDMFKRVKANVIPIQEPMSDLVSAGFKEVKGSNAYWQPPIKVLPP